MDVHVANLTGEPLPLPPGDYWCLWKQADGRVRQLAFAIRPGETTAIGVPPGSADESR